MRQLLVIVTIIKYLPVPDRECTVVQQNQCKTVSETTVEEDCKTESKRECATKLDTKYETEYEEKCTDLKHFLDNDIFCCLDQLCPT